VFALAAAVVILAGAGAGVWYKFLRTDVDDTIAPPTTVSKPKADTLAKAPAVPAKDSSAAKTAESETAKPKLDTAKPSPAKVAAAPKPEPKPLPPPPPKPEPKPEPIAPVAAAPQIVAPPLAGGVVNQVLAESQTKSGAASMPTRFEDLSAPARVAYQKFAFERILSVVRQVTAPSIRYSRVRIFSPGLVVLQGSTTDSGALRSLVQGLLAQSLIDTVLKVGPKGQFALAARLPFNASFGGQGTASDDFSRTVTQARDLAQARTWRSPLPARP